MFGKPVIKGTRIPVDLILEKMANGKTIEMLLKSYSKLTEESIRACLFFERSIKLALIAKAAQDPIYLQDMQEIEIDFCEVKTF